MTGFSEYGNAPMGSIKFREILDSMTNHKLFKESSASWIQVIPNPRILGNH
jgi:hypothetical protein